MGNYFQRIGKYIAGLDPRAKVIGGLALLFSLLVAAGVHGSSTGVTAGWWQPHQPYTGYLFEQPDGLSPETAEWAATLLMRRARYIRWDEYIVGTPFVLSQLSHQPRFPVINRNIGAGQNMLVNFHYPVWHVTALARPATWGYFLFGARRGLAWFWWFQVFACFAALFLLLDVVLRGRRGLAAFGAFWFCASAHVVCWSLWPAFTTSVAALSCLAAYHLLKSDRPATHLVNGLLLGLSLPGFVMCLYPPWQVQVAHVVLVLFAGLFFRDGLYRAFSRFSWSRALGLVGALLLAGGLLAALYAACREDIQVMSGTLYPGKRVALGGDHSLEMLFRGWHNLKTIYEAPGALKNETEAASYYLLFPAAFGAVLLSRRRLARLGAVGWLLASYIVTMLLFLLVGFPEKLAKLTLLSYVPVYRADIGIGLASIILCVYVLKLAADLRREPSGRWERLRPWVVAAGVAGLFLLHGLATVRLTEGAVSRPLVYGMVLAGGVLSYCLAAGRVRLFCGLMGGLAAATTAFFNPLATNLDHIYHTELAQAIVRLNREAGGRPLWLCYETADKGALVSILGGQSLAGVHWPPQLDLWRKIDPAGIFKHRYNRYAEVVLGYTDRANDVHFSSPKQDHLRLRISPHNPALLEMGARFVLVSGGTQEVVTASGLPRVFQTADKAHSIFEIPHP